MKYKYVARFTLNDTNVKIEKQSMTELRGALMDTTNLPVETFKRVTSMAPNQIIILSGELARVYGIARIATSKERA